MATTTRSRRSADTAPAAPTPEPAAALPAAPARKAAAKTAAKTAGRKAAAGRSAPEQPAAKAPAQAAVKAAAKASAKTAGTPVAAKPAKAAGERPAKAPVKATAQAVGNAAAKAPAKASAKTPAKAPAKAAAPTARKALPAASAEAPKLPSAVAPAEPQTPKPAKTAASASAGARASTPEKGVTPKPAGKTPRATAGSAPSKAAAPAPAPAPTRKAAATRKKTAPVETAGALGSAALPRDLAPPSPTPPAASIATPAATPAAAEAPRKGRSVRTAQGAGAVAVPDAPPSKAAAKRPRAKRSAPKADAADAATLPATPPVALPAPQDEAAGDSASAQPAVSAEQTLAPVVESHFRWQPPDADEVFEPIDLEDTRDGSRCTLQLRGLAAGDNRCTCGAPWRSLDGQCQHLRFVLDALSQEPEAAAVLAHGWHPLHSEVYLRLGARRSLRWSAGSICPPELDAAAQALQDEDGDLQLDHPAALPSLLRLAEEHGQVLRVADDAWQHLARRRDAGNRLRRLQQAYPEGPESPALRQLLKLPLRPYQAEGALFAAVAGRALLADEDGLGKTVQAVAALELALRHFGVERALVVGSASREGHWQQALAEWAGRPLQPLHGGEATVRWASLAELAAAPDALAGWAPELLVVDEAVDEGAEPFDPSLLAALDAPSVLLVTREPLEDRPEALLPRVEWLDAGRLGPLARFLAYHLPDGPGSGLVALQGLDKTLRHLMLRRRRDDVAEQLPESVELTWPAPLGADQRRLHDTAADEARAVLARWQRSHFVSDSGQHALAGALRRMLESCTDTGADAPAKLDALLALLPELLGRPDTRVVVCAARPQTALHAGRRLAAAGIDHAVFGASEAMRRQLEGNTQLRVVLCADSNRERLPSQPLKTVLVHLDPPAQPAIQQRRLQRVQGGAPARNLPAVLLLAPDTLEQALWELPPEDRTQVAEVIAGQGAQAFLEGEALERFMATAAKLLQGTPRL